MQLVLIEDDQGIVELIQTILRVGFSDMNVRATHLGARGIELVQELKPDAVILDLGLPDISGFEVLKEIRDFSKVPVLIISVRANETAIVDGLGLGADDYVVKPFRQLELLARLKNMLRRKEDGSENLSAAYGAWRFGSTLQELYYGDSCVLLTKVESKLMYQLVINKGNVVTVSALSKAIWGNDYAIKDIKVYIYRLRKKFEHDFKNPRIILSKPGIGYYLSK